MKIQLAGFLDNSSVNGFGVRSVIFMSGCKHNCPNCHNKEMQDFNYGESLDIETVVKRVVKNSPITDGVTISGGDPMFSPEVLLDLLKQLKENKINVWVYTGFTYDLLIKNDKYKEILKYVDILVEGLYVEELKDDNCKYYGSSNQNIVDVQLSLIEGMVTFLDL